jgi:hypothetical protein
MLHRPGGNPGTKILDLRSLIKLPVIRMALSI